MPACTYDDNQFTNAAGKARGGLLTVPSISLQLRPRIYGLLGMFRKATSTAYPSMIPKAVKTCLYGNTTLTSMEDI